MSTYVVPVSVYFRVFAALLLLTAVTVWVAFLDLGNANAVLALVIASLKAALVVLYFMHVRYSGRLTWLFTATGLFFIVVLIGLTLSDFLSRGWLGVPGK